MYFLCVCLFRFLKKCKLNCLRVLGLTHRCVISSPYCTPPSCIKSEEWSAMSFYSLQIPLGRRMSENHSLMPFEVTRLSLEVNHSLLLKAEGTNDSVLGRNLFDSFLNYSHLVSRTSQWSARLWAFSWIVMGAVWSKVPSPPASAAPWMHPAPIHQTADYWVNSWNTYLATGSVHPVHLIQLSVFLKYKQSTPIKHMGRSHVGADRWVKPQSCQFSPPSDLGWI